MNFSALTVCPLVAARRNQVSESIRVVAVIMPIAELIEIERQIVLADLVIGADHAALQEAPEAFDIIGMDVSANIFVLTVMHAVMRQAEMLIGWRFVSYYQRYTILGERSNEAGLSPRFHVADDTRHDVAFALNSANHANLAEADALVGLLQASTRTFGFALLGALFAPMAIAVLTANIGFVNLDNAAHGMHVTGHSRTPAMADIPASPPIRTGIFAKDDAANLQRTHAFLGGQHEVADFEPNPQRYFSVHKDGSGSDAKAITGTLAAIGIAASPAIGWSAVFALDRVYLLCALAARTADTIRPTMPDDVFLACVISRELPVELFKALHVLKLAGFMMTVNTNKIATKAGTIRK